MNISKKSKQGQLASQLALINVNQSDKSHWAFDVEMHRKIEVEAYLKAENDGFPGNAEDYWIMAEHDIGCAHPYLKFSY